jgi:hypothetical protein
VAHTATFTLCSCGCGCQRWWMLERVAPIRLCRHWEGATGSHMLFHRSLRRKVVAAAAVVGMTAHPAQTYSSVNGAGLAAAAAALEPTLEAALEHALEAVLALALS